MRRIFILLTLLLIPISTARAQTQIQLSDVGVDYVFGQTLTFHARFTSATPITRVDVIFRAAGEANARVMQAQFDNTGLALYQFNDTNNLIRPFSVVTYRFRVTLQDGQSVETQDFTLNYDDNRFQWETRAQNSVRVHWYNRDPAYGQSAADAAGRGLQKISSTFGLNLSAPVDIYLYTSDLDLHSALGVNSPYWVAGHASPDLDVALVAVVPDAEARQAMERQIPHELAHILLYRGVGADTYTRLPAWMREGVASLAELNPNPDYNRALRAALQNRTLIPLADLCAAFPPDAARTFLAYAEAESFTRYIVETRGALALLNLSNAYRDGLSCSQGTQQALGAPLDRLEREWRNNELGENQWGQALLNALPVLLLFAVILLPTLVIMFSGGRKHE
jgi:hypothetical protein